jgi:DNA polymerase elongation subunit (family B)
MLHSIPTDSVLFLDIETVPQYANFEELTDAEKALWEHKAQFLAKNGETAADIYGKAGIYAEFGRIVCISVGCVLNEDGQQRWWSKSFADHDERTLLQDFTQMLNRFCKSKARARLCGHNAKEFDFPYIIRRILVLGVPLPPVLQVFGQRPWETPFLDTMELWKFGDYKNFTSLALMAHIFGIPTPKDDIDGSMVAGVYYEDKDLARIAAYCEKDVLTTARIFLKLKGVPDVINVEN